MDRISEFKSFDAGEGCTTQAVSWHRRSAKAQVHYILQESLSEYQMISEGLIQLGQKRKEKVWVMSHWRRLAQQAYSLDRIMGGARHEGIALAF